MMIDINNEDKAMMNLLSIAKKNKKLNWDKEERYKLVTLILVANSRLDPIQFLNNCDMMKPAMLELLEQENVLEERKIFDYVKDINDKEKRHLLLQMIKKNFFSPHPDAFRQKVLFVFLK